jgi:5-formyltetrahydrofolate cyclo-ligase
MNKSALRNLLRKKRLCLSPKEVREKSQRIAKRVMGLAEFHRAERVVLYSPISNEVDTDILWQTTLQGGKEPYFPRIRKAEKQIEFVYANTRESLRPATYGILEPSGRCLLLPEADQEILILVPGLGFDFEGYRLGWGGGYYDRTFCGMVKKGTRVGLAYNFQVLSSLPHEDGDERVDYVITEERVIVCSANRGSPPFLSVKEVRSR